MAIALPAFVHRNPRYTVLLIFVLVCSTFLLIPFHAPSVAPYADYLPSKFRPGVSLEEWVRREEIHYGETLRARKDMITKYGPEPSKVDPYVTFAVDEVYPGC